MNIEDSEFIYHGIVARALRHLSIMDSLEDFASVAANYCSELVVAARTDLIFYEPTSDKCWRSDINFGRRNIESGGLVGLVVSKKQTINIQNCGVDARYVKDIDNPNGTVQDALAIIPIMESHGNLLGVFVFTRPEQFKPEEIKRLESYIKRIASLIESLYLNLKIEDELKKIASTKSDSLYDPEALAFHRNGMRYSEPLEYPKLTPIYFFYLIILAVFALFIFIFVNKDFPSIYANAIVLSNSANDRIQKSYHASDVMGFLHDGSFERSYSNSNNVQLSTTRIQPATFLKSSDLLVVIYIEAINRRFVKVGDELNLELMGYSKIHCKIRVQNIYERVVSPREMDDFYGKGFFGPNDVKEPIVFLDAAVSNDCNNDAVRITPGMRGKVAIQRGLAQHTPLF